MGDRDSKMKLSYLEEQTEEPILFQKPVVREELLDMSDNLKSLLARTNDILGQAKLLQVEAQEEMANEDLKTFEKSGNLPKLTPVLFNKRKESDILKTHRGNYKRHWETSSSLSWEHVPTAIRKPRYQFYKSQHYLSYYTTPHP